MSCNWGSCFEVVFFSSLTANTLNYWCTIGRNKVMLRLLLRILNVLILMGLIRKIRKWRIGIKVWKRIGESWETSNLPCCAFILKWLLFVCRYADNKNFLLTYLNVPLFDIPEYIIPGEDVEVRDKVLEAVS